MGKTVIDEDELVDLVEAGWTQSAIAQRAGCSRQAICKRLKHLNIKQRKLLIRNPQKVEKLLNGRLDAISAIHKANSTTLEMLAAVEKEILETDNDQIRDGKRALQLKIVGTLRSLGDLQYRIDRDMYQWKTISTIFRAILHEIEGIDPCVYQEVLTKLNWKFRNYFRDEEGPN